MQSSLHHHHAHHSHATGAAWTRMA